MTLASSSQASCHSLAQFLHGKRCAIWWHKSCFPAQLAQCLHGVGESPHWGGPKAARKGPIPQWKVSVIFNTFIATHVGSSGCSAGLPSDFREA